VEEGKDDLELPEKEEIEEEKGLNLSFSWS